MLVLSPVGSIVRLCPDCGHRGGDDELECFVLINNLDSMLVLLGRRPIADRRKMAVHGCVEATVMRSGNKNNCASGVFVLSVTPKLPCWMLATEYKRRRNFR